VTLYSVRYVAGRPVRVPMPDPAHEGPVVAPAASHEAAPASSPWVPGAASTGSHEAHERSTGARCEAASGGAGHSGHGPAEPVVEAERRAPAMAASADIPHGMEPGDVVAWSNSTRHGLGFVLRADDPDTLVVRPFPPVASNTVKVRADRVRRLTTHERLAELVWQEAGS